MKYELTEEGKRRLEEKLYSIECNNVHKEWDEMDRLSTMFEEKFGKYLEKVEKLTDEERIEKIYLESIGCEEDDEWLYQ